MKDHPYEGRRITPIRGLDRALYSAVVALAEMQGTTVGEQVNKIFKNYFSGGKKMIIMPKNLFVKELKNHFSEEAAAALYGWAETWADDEVFNPAEISRTWTEYGNLNLACQEYDIPLLPPRERHEDQNEYYEKELRALGLEVIKFDNDSQYLIGEIN